MKQFSYVLTKPHALHAKPVNALVRELSRFSSSVHLAQGECVVSIRDAHDLPDTNCGSRITVTVEGKDEEAAVAAVQNYFVDKM